MRHRIVVSSGQGWTAIILLLEERARKFRILVENEDKRRIVRKM
jgi:hypothetical protein